MNRRELLEGMGLVLAAQGNQPFARAAQTAPNSRPVALPGTQPLTWEGDDFWQRIMDEAYRYVDGKIAESVKTRQRYWKRDVSSGAAYEKSITPNRDRFRKQIGAIDSRLPVVMERSGAVDDPALVGETDKYSILQVRWPVLKGVTGGGSLVTGEGLLLTPKNDPLGYVVALPDADQTPEQVVGLALGIADEKQYARKLAENGFEVLVPVLIDRTSRWAGHPGIQMTDQSDREWIYRQSFQMGRHVIGYEVQKVLAAVDWYDQKREKDKKIGVVGYFEGGLIAFYAATLDPRIDAVLVSGYFDTRQNVWSEPIYRNVWALLHEFGDAELATLIAPRALIVEYSGVPTITSAKGDLRTPAFQTVKAEFDRITSLLSEGFQPRDLVSGPGGTPIGPGSQRALQRFVQHLGAKLQTRTSDQLPIDRRRPFDPSKRLERQLRELETFTQELVRESANVRRQRYLYKVMPELADLTWTTTLSHRTYSPNKFIEASKRYRQYFWEEVLGKFNEPLAPANPRTRRIYDTPKWVGYNVVLDVWPGLSAWGILLLPKDLKRGERRPVVVCQHGRDGVPQDVIVGNNTYHQFAARLADQGFITFAPFNLYKGEERYRFLSRKANGVKASLFSFIIGQHDQILRWLKTLPMVDPKRIAFYGLSYGGESAVRVPTILEDYCLSICSGDFNSWTRKTAATDKRFSFMYTNEWEMYYFNESSTFDYAEMTYLMIPRPFMVERGHWDHVGRDRWVAYEYAKVAWLYAQFEMSDATSIAYYDGGHTIYGKGTFQFLHKHLNWPERQTRQPVA